MCRYLTCLSDSESCSLKESSIVVAHTQVGGWFFQPTKQIFGDGSPGLTQVALLYEY